MKQQMTAKQLRVQEKAKARLTADEYSALIADANDGLAAIDAIMREVNAEKYSDRLATDAVPNNLLPRLLEIVIAQAEREYEVSYPWRDIFPVDTYDWTKKTIVIPVWTSEGVARWYNGGGAHPNVATGMREVTISLRNLTASYVLDWLRVQQETGAGINTEVEMNNRVMEAHDAFISDVVFVGDAAMNIQPFVGHTNMGSGSVPNGEWDTAGTTGQQMYDDVLYACQQMFNQNIGVAKMAKGQIQLDVLLPSSMYDIADSEIVNSYTGESVLDYLAKKTFIRSVKSVPRLDTAACGSGDYIIVGVFTNEHIAVTVGADKMAMPRTEGGWFIEQPYLSSTGGVHLKRPLSFWRGTDLKT